MWVQKAVAQALNASPSRSKEEALHALMKLATLQVSGRCCLHLSAEALTCLEALQVCDVPRFCAFKTPT